MRDGDGFSVLEFMQKNSGWSVVPRVMYSSSDDPDDVRTSYLLGATVFHKKVAGQSNLEHQMRQIIEYWATSEVPPIDESGRLLVTKHAGRLGERYPQPKGGACMCRPGQPSTEEDQSNTDRFTSAERGEPNSEFRSPAGHGHEPSEGNQIEGNSIESCERWGRSQRRAEVLNESEAFVRPGQKGKTGCKNDTI